MERLERAGRLDGLLAQTQSKPLPTDFPVSLSDADLARGAVDVNASEFIDFVDGTQSTHPEDLPLLHFYKSFFGWWPNCYGYLYRYPEAYRAVLYTTLMGAVMSPPMQLVGETLQHAMAFSSSEAHGCDYCQVHTAAISGDVGTAHSVKKARHGEAASGEAAFTELERALLDVAGKATTNDVPQELLDHIRALEPEKGDDYIAAAGMIASIFGFLNTFNDLASVEIEAGWNRDVQDVFTVEMGKHGQKSAGDGNPDNLNFDLPMGELTLPEILARYDAKAGGDYAAYMQETLGVAPNWEHAWHGPIRARHAAMYVELMGADGPSPKVAAEMKHLMARVSAIVRGHDYLAAVEGYMAYVAAADKAAALDRLRACYETALGRGGAALFSPAERAALGLAAASAQIPLVTLAKTMEPLRDQFDQDEIVQLFVVCAVVGSLQRWCAVAKPDIEPEVAAFAKQHDLALDATAYKFGLV